MKLPINVDLKDRVAVVTGGGGVLCSHFAKALGASGAKVAVCDLRPEAAQKVADEITADGGIAIAVTANVLDKESLEAAREEINSKLGICDILLNGAGGNNPKGTTTKEYLSPEDLEEKKDDILFCCCLCCYWSCDDAFGTVIPGDLQHNRYRKGLCDKTDPYCSCIYAILFLLSCNLFYLTFRRENSSYVLI